MHLRVQGACGRLWQTACLLPPAAGGGSLPSSSLQSHYMRDQVCAVPDFCAAASARVLWRAVSFLISASLVDNTVHEVMKHRALLP